MLLEFNLKKNSFITNVVRVGNGKVKNPYKIGFQNLRHAWKNVGINEFIDK